jgi:hypothetical protein
MKKAPCRLALRRRGSHTGANISEFIQENLSKEDIKVLLSVALRGKMSSSDFSVQNS